MSGAEPQHPVAEILSRGGRPNLILPCRGLIGIVSDPQKRDPVAIQHNRGPCDRRAENSLKDQADAQSDQTQKPGQIPKSPPRSGIHSHIQPPDS